MPFTSNERKTFTEDKKISTEIKDIELYFNIDVRATSQVFNKLAISNFKTKHLRAVLCKVSKVGNEKF